MPVLTCFRNESDRQERLSLRPLPPKSQNGQSQSLPLRGANENRTDLRRLPDTMPKYLTVFESVYSDVRILTISRVTALTIVFGCFDLNLFHHLW